MRRAFFALLLAGSLIAAPALAAEPQPPVSAVIVRDFSTGASFYFTKMSSWFQDVLFGLGLSKPSTLIGDGEECGESGNCGPGLICLNDCGSASCERYDKRCLRGGGSSVVLAEFSPCSNQDLCAKGTDCASLCRPGLDCADAKYRCLKPVEPIGSCQVDSDCTAVCGQLLFPPIGPGAYDATCVQNACHCDPVETRPDAQRVECPKDVHGAVVTLSCPNGALSSCTPGVCAKGYCPLQQTCVTAPLFGGVCRSDAECAEASCETGAQPFCDATQHCKCRLKQSETIACKTTADCSASDCTADEAVACLNGNCACAPKAALSACKTVADCSANCPASFTPACVKDSCVCQKTTIVPYACKTVDDCSVISCPTGYDKTCHENVCACAHQAAQ